MAGLDNERASAALGTSFDASGAPVIRLAGELDISNVASIESQLESIISSSPRVSFDLSALTFMDSSGIAMFLRAAERTGTVALRRPSDTIRRVIRATGLTEVFEIVDD
jgi:anti-sigma B factor antagonist